MLLFTFISLFTFYHNIALDQFVHMLSTEDSSFYTVHKLSLRCYTIVKFGVSRKPDSTIPIVFF